MFIGGLNWETTDRTSLFYLFSTNEEERSNFLLPESLKEYFQQFGEVQECTVMRDGASGRSRGFGFLTFKDPRTVNVVMVKEHYLDGKIVRPDISTSTKAPSRLSKHSPNVASGSLSTKIDPKRAIPRDEQERTSKIFVGGVSQEANEQVFKEYFAQYGRVVDATLMMDKDTGRPRGFGFVTFDSEAAVDATLAGDLTILGKPIEVKKAQPRGNMREDEQESLGRGGGGGRGGRGGRGKDFNDRNDYNNGNGQPQNNQNQQGSNSGMTPQMMAQYWQKMQAYFATMQQQMAASAMAGGMGGMNPAMMQQMQQMQAMQQMKAMQMAQGQQGQQGSGSQSPMPEGHNAHAMQGMNPQMMQQMQQMQAMQQQQMQQQQMQQQQIQQQQMQGHPMQQSNSNPGAPPGGRRGTPGYNAQDQLAFEQQKYEQQQARRAAQEAQQMNYGNGGGGPTSWEGMYDDVPQPDMGGGGRGGGRGGFVKRGGGGGGGRDGGSQGPKEAPPANAPKGPKNAGQPGANYRGGGRGGHRGFHPYQR